MKEPNTPPVVLRVGNTDFILNDVNEQRVKQRLYAKYKPDTLVQEIVDSVIINTIKLRDIFAE